MLLCCYSAIAAYIAAIGPGRASSGRDEWGLTPNTMRSGSAHVQQLTTHATATASRATTRH
eukprot:scaffold17161_cov196-Isochrysis_galbana.AAC.1